jgi:predicted DNA-binding protein (UPF0251 family)
MSAPKKKRRSREMLCLNGHTVSRSLYEKITAAEEELRRLNDRERLNLPDIAARLGVTRETAQTYALVLNIKIHNFAARPRINKQAWPTVLPTLRNTGLTYAQIGEKIGASKISVCRWFLNQGIVTNNHYRN